MKSTCYNLEMRFFLIVCSFLAVCFGKETYDTSKFKNIDVDEILSNKRLVNNYFKCLMGTSQCTPDGEELKKILPDAIKTGCAKCSEGQIEIAKKVGEKLRKDYEDLWIQLSNKFDPDGVYRKKYREELRKAGFLDE